MSLSEQQIHYLQLWFLVNHSITTFNQLVNYYGSIEAATKQQALNDWAKLKLHKSHLQRLDSWKQGEGQQKFLKILKMIDNSSQQVILDTDHRYPSQLKQIDHAPPLLLVEGDASVLSLPQIAIVGSRKPSRNGEKIAFEFSQFLAQHGFWINSGLAYGIDAAAHHGGLTANRTIAIIASGLDQCYPKNHIDLKNKIIAQQGAIVTEFLPTTAPLQYHFPRRNRIVAGLSLGVLVVEASLSSGSLITAQQAASQGKLVFAVPGSIYGGYHLGCHHLIREGAILVDHPQQIIEDLALPTIWQQDSSQYNAVSDDCSSTIPAHLQAIYQQLDWDGKSIDALSHTMKLAISELSGQIVELEILGLCTQHAGLIVKSRLNINVP